MSVRSRQTSFLYPRSFPPSLSLRGSIHFTSGNTCASRCTALSPRNFLSTPFLNCAQDHPFSAANSRKTRRRIVIPLSGMHSEECSRVNTTVSYKCSCGSFNISAYLPTNGSEKQVSCVAKQPSPCYTPAERTYFNFVATNQNRRNRR